MKRVLLLPLLFLPFLSLAQTIEVSGSVKSATGEPLVGASVVERGTTNGATTDVSGNYSLSVNSSATLVFSFVGYKTQEIQVGGRKTLNVTLAEDASQLSEVTVKGFIGVVGQARRRAESIQSIPESVVTFTSEEIENKAITNVQTFTDRVPNVNFFSSQNIGTNFITVRGISQIRNAESPIAFVVDGVTLPDPNLINQELFDLALIEVVKGPQGTLYGRNAIAGAINVVTQQPTNEFKNKVSAGYGSGNLFKGMLVSTGPIIKDKFFYRISGAYKRGDGVIRNENLDKPVDFIRDLTLRGQLKANFSSSVSATLTGQLIDARAGAAYYARPKSATETTFLPDDFDSQAILADQFGESTLRARYGNLKVEAAFGKMKLTSSTTYNTGDRNHIGDLDFTALDILRQDQDSDTRTINQEFRLSSKDEESKFSWDAGVFYQNLERLLITRANADFGFFPPNDPPAPTGGAISPLGVGDFTNVYNTWAVFGFVDYKLSDKFTISAGLRYDNDQISQDNRTNNTNPDTTNALLQPKASLAYKISKQTMIYANYGRGYRSGGFNQGQSVRYPTSYKPETSNNYELGIKNSYWNDRLVLNLSGYYIDFENQQLYALVLASPNILIGNFNVSKSRSYGFEAEFKLRPSKYFDILAGYGLSRSEMLDGTSTYSTPGNESFSVAGKNTPLIPQDSYSIGLESSIALSEKLTFNGNIHLKGTGRIYWHEDNRKSSAPYSLLNARLGLTLNQKLTLAGWGTNITNTKYNLEFFGQPFSNGSSDFVWKGLPAMFGVDLSYTF